ncbi:hypothetical protein CVT25_012072 [Psilocybe cyanescens]|uniref:Uncharacterized protein n=1 Tax=Psilocybe cyanescens TaxID=93625 RepID=A0A409VMW6_PSICY|nr:hypothetical protein CVT25_012072 [Psilocybe cyanescens]
MRLARAPLSSIRLVLSHTPFMENLSFLITQNIFRLRYPPAVAQCCHERDLPKHLDLFMESIEDGTIGLASIYGSKGRMTTLVLSSLTQALVVTQLFSQGEKESKGNKKTTSPLHDLLCNPNIMKSAFHMDKLSAALFFDHEMRISSGKDLLSLSKETRGSLAAFMAVLGNESIVFKEAVTDIFFKEGSHQEKSKMVALQAWVACSASLRPAMLPRLKETPSIDTVAIEKQILTVISKTIRVMDRLIALKPIRNKHNIEATSVNNSIISNRYKTKISRLTGTQQLCITFSRDGMTEDLRTSTGVRIIGRQTKINIGGKRVLFESIKSAETVGREEPNAAQASRSDIMLLALQQRISLAKDPFVSSIWGLSNTTWTADSKTPSSPAIFFPSKRKLNESQSVAVSSILSNTDANRVVLIHGPPGTGKTTVIAATVTSTMASSDSERTLWLVAHSNVAVKNIAEKLATEDFWAFKIIVSKDFHFDWHEHLYKKIEENVIRSESLSEDPVGVARQLLVPLRTVIFDEASQIEIGDYFPVLVKFKSTLQKLVFIGDDKQLAPYGTSDIPDLESIFEKSHLRERAVFLDTQYRMPIPIGEFISKNVYSGKLKSHHKIVNPSCCRFVDVSDGVETSQGRSWTNEQEVKVVLEIARQLVGCRKSFRIITPYDAQRSLLENCLKRAKLPWENKCFNVDSFQGNEDDYIIVSLVRTARLGFLIDTRRVNVMLTRCKMGMIICTKRDFVEGAAAETLAGKLQKSLGGSTWVNGKNVLHKHTKTFV